MTLWKKFVRAFFYKNSSFSKTALFLSIAIFMTLLMWPFQSLFVGATFGFWTVPPFNSEAVLAVIGVISGLYIANHSKMVTGRPSERVEEKEIGD